MSEETRAKVRAAWPAILEGLSGGAFIRDLCKEHGLSEHVLRAYRGENATADKEWATAREASGDAFAERALEMALNPAQIVPQEGDAPPLVIKLDPAHARNAIDTLKWAARIRNPRAYSDKSTVDLNVRSVDLTRIIQDANARLAAARAVGQVIEGEVVRAAIAAPAELDDLL